MAVARCAKSLPLPGERSCSVGTPYRKRGYGMLRFFQDHSSVGGRGAPSRIEGWLRPVGGHPDVTQHRCRRPPASMSGSSGRSSKRRRSEQRRRGKFYRCRRPVEACACLASLPGCREHAFGQLRYREEAVEEGLESRRGQKRQNDEYGADDNARGHIAGPNVLRVLRRRLSACRRARCRRPEHEAPTIKAIAVCVMA